MGGLPRVGSQGGGVVTPEGDSTKHGAVEESVRMKNDVVETVPRTRRRAAGVKVDVVMEKSCVGGVDVSSSTKKLPAAPVAASKAKKTVKKNTKKSDAVRYEDGLGALHAAMRLSGSIHFDDDPTAVIKAEALEDRKVRMMAQSQTKRKRGRPRKVDTVSTAGRKRVTRSRVCDTTQDDEGDAQEASGSLEENNTDGGKRKSTRKSVLSKALVKVEDARAAGEENSNGEEDAIPKKPVINNLADKTLDAENWSLKDIVKWGNARERKLAKEQAKTQQKTYVRPPVQPVQEAEPPLLHPKVHVKDGKIVVDQTSLTVAAQQKEEYTKIVTEDSHSINSMSYVNRLSNDRWSIEDTELFFRVCVSCDSF